MKTWPRCLLLGTHRNTVSTWERNVVTPGVDLLLRIYEEFNVNINWLLSGQGETYRPENKWSKLNLAVKNSDSKLPFLNSRNMAPIKRLVSIKNTYPSQKETIFSQKQYSDRSQSLFYCLRPVFQTVVVCTFSSICYQAPIGIKADEKKQIHRPWSISGPQKNIGTLSCPKGCNKISGSLRPTIAGAWQRQIKKKNFKPDLILGNAAMCQPRRMVVNHHSPRDHRCIPGLTG